MKKLLFIVASLLMSTNLYAKDISTELRKELESKGISFPQVFYKYGEGPEVMNELNRVKDHYDFDKDGALDYYEVFRNFTDPKKPDSDGDGILDGDFKESMEYTYTMVYDYRILKPYDVDYMNSVFSQQVEVVNETDDYIDVKLYLFPFTKLSDTFSYNKNWKQDNLKVEGYSEYMKENYDPVFHKALLEDLASEGIYPDKLTDSELVNRVSRFIMDKIDTLHDLSSDYHMWDWFVEEKDGKYQFKEEVIKRKFIDHSGKNNIDSILKEFNAMYNEDYNQDDLLSLIGSTKNQYYEKKMGSCTSYANMTSLIFNALGIPTKALAIQTVHDITEINNNDEMYQYNYEKFNGLSNNKMKNQILNGVKKLNATNHVMNQMYIGNQWYMIDMTAYLKNIDPIYGELTLFYITANYDFDEILNIISHRFITRLDEYKDTDVKINNRFNKNYTKNNLESLGYKFYDVSDKYGEHTTPKTMKFIDKYEDPSRRFKFKFNQK